MREIKFRAWRKYEKKNRMIEVKGLSFDYCNDTGYKGEEIGVLEGKPYVDECSIEKFDTLQVANHHPMVDTCILMQYTGLKDKNGKEIWEGDILKVLTKSKGVVYYENGGFRTDCLFKSSLIYLADNKARIEVIGNIYENPELLEKEKKENNT